MSRPTLAPHDAGDVSGSDANPAFDIIDTDLNVLADCMASLLSFTRATTHLVAREHGVQVFDSRFDVCAELDTVRGRHTEPSVAGLRLRAELTTDASADQLGRLRAETERRCPMLAVLRHNGVTVTSEWTLRRAASGGARPPSRRRTGT